MNVEPRIPLSPALGAYLGLRRAVRGHLAYDDGLRRFVDGGRLTPSYLDEPLRILVTQGFLRLAPGGHSHPVEITPTGRDRYRQLCQDRQQRT